MKKNIIYFTILIILLTFTYFFQELKFWDKKNSSLTKNLKINEIDSIYFSKSQIDLKPTPTLRPYDFSVDLQVLNNYLNFLSYIDLKKELDYSNEKFSIYFTNEKRIKIRKSNLLEISFILGDQVPGEEEFYWLESIGNKKRLYIASYNEKIPEGQNKYYEEKLISSFIS